MEPTTSTSTIRKRGRPRKDARSQILERPSTPISNVGNRPPRSCFASIDSARKIKRGRGRPPKNNMDSSSSVLDSSQDDTLNTDIYKVEHKSVCEPLVTESAETSVQDQTVSQLPTQKRRGRPPKTPVAQSSTFTSTEEASCPRKSCKNLSDDNEPMEIDSPASSQQTSKSAPLPTQKRRGRPPKVRNSMILERAAPENSVTAPEIIKRTRGRPCKEASVSTTAVSSTVVDQTNSAPQFKRGRGRPSKITNSDTPASSLNNSENTLSTALKMTKRGRGRPRKESTTSTPVINSPDLAFQTEKRGRGRPPKRSLQANNGENMVKTPSGGENVIRRKRGRPTKTPRHIGMNTTMNSSADDYSPDAKRLRISTTDKNNSNKKNTPKMSILQLDSQSSTQTQLDSAPRKRGRPMKIKTINKLNNNKETSHDRQLEDSAASSTTSSTTSRSRMSLRLNSNFATYVIAVPMNNLRLPTNVNIDEAVSQLRHVYSLIEDEQIPEFHRRLQSVAFQIIENDSSFIRVSSPRR